MWRQFRQNRIVSEKEQIIVLRFVTLGPSETYRAVERNLAVLENRKAEEANPHKAKL